MIEPDIFYLVQLRASAIEQMGKDGYTWIGPEHVIRLLDAFDALRARVAELEAALTKIVVGDPDYWNIARTALRARVAELEIERQMEVMVWENEATALRARVAELEAALKEARGWVQDDVDADPRKRGTDVLARIDEALDANAG